MWRLRLTWLLQLGAGWSDKWLRDCALYKFIITIRLRLARGRSTVSRLLHSNLHWIDIPQRVQYKLGLTVHRWWQQKSPEYCCTQVSDVAGRRHPSSVNLVNSNCMNNCCSYCLSRFGRQAFSVAGPTPESDTKHRQFLYFAENYIIHELSVLQRIRGCINWWALTLTLEGFNTDAKSVAGVAFRSCPSCMLA